MLITFLSPWSEWQPPGQCTFELVEMALQHEQQDLHLHLNKAEYETNM